MAHATARGRCRQRRRRPVAMGRAQPRVSPGPVAALGLPAPARPSPGGWYPCRCLCTRHPTGFAVRPSGWSRMQDQKDAYPAKYRILVGTIGQTAEGRTTPGADPITSISRATSRPRLLDGRTGATRPAIGSWTPHHVLEQSRQSGRRAWRKRHEGRRSGPIHATKGIDSRGNDRYGGKISPEQVSLPRAARRRPRRRNPALKARSPLGSGGASRRVPGDLGAWLCVLISRSSAWGRPIACRSA